MSIGHSNAQVNNHSLYNPINFKITTTDISNGKQHFRPALSSRDSADADTIDDLSIHASDLEHKEIPLNKAVADLRMQFKDFPDKSDAHGLLNTLAQAPQAPSAVSGAIGPTLVEIVSYLWTCFFPRKTEAHL